MRRSVIDDSHSSNDQPRRPCPRARHGRFLAQGVARRARPTNSLDEAINLGQDGLDFVQGNQHPEVPLDMESCNRNYAKDYSEEVTLDVSSVARADGWQVPVGGWDVEGDGSTFTPSGRIYVMKVQSNLFGELELHLAVIDGRAYSFWSCTE